MKLHSLLLIVVLLLLLLTRAPLFGGYGRYFFGDEIRYNRLIVTLKDAQKTKNPLLYLQGIFAIHARPGYAMLYTPVIWLEKINRESVDFIQNSVNDFPYGVLLNLIINILMMMLVYLILKHFLDFKVTIVATLMVSFSVTSVIYLRHMLPYDASLAVLLSAFLLYLKTNSFFLFGFLTAISFLIYPSYLYYLIPIPLLILFAKPVKKIVPFMMGLIIPLGLMELFSRIVGADSYLLTLQQLNSSVAELAQGDFMPAGVFLAEYINGNDGYWGLILSSLAPLLVLFRKKKHNLYFLIYLVIVLLLFELFSHIIPKTVLYGRTVRPYYFLLLISSVVVLDGIFKKLGQKIRLPYFLFLIFFSVIGFANWWPRFNNLKDLTYPTAIRQEAEFYLQQRYGSYQLEDVYTKKRSESDTTTDPAVLESTKFYLVNPTLLYPYYGSLEAPCRKEILFEKDHPLNFKAYHFEGYTSRMRSLIIYDPPTYKLIYCK